jgi:hypothetical protein
MRIGIKEISEATENIIIALIGTATVLGEYVLEDWVDKRKYQRRKRKSVPTGHKGTAVVGGEQTT